MATPLIVNLLFLDIVANKPIPALAFCVAFIQMVDAVSITQNRVD
jgi:hypothetical protein